MAVRTDHRPPLTLHVGKLMQSRPYFFIEKAGRRKVMMSSAAGCSFCMVMIAVMLKVNTLAVSLFYLHLPSDNGPNNEPNSPIGYS